MLQADHAPAGVLPRADKRVALWSILAFWAFYYVLNTARMAIAGDPFQLEMLPRRAVVTLMGIGLSLAMYALLRALEARSMRVLLATTFLTAVPASVIYACTNYAVFYVLASREMLMHETTASKLVHDSALIEISELAVSWYFFIAAWGVLYVALSYAARMANAERQAARYRSQAQAAQLRALRYQINPHFLFNTLNSLSTLVLKGQTAEAERMIASLASFFRASLTSDAAADTSLADEIAMQRLYLSIEQVRFPTRLGVSVDLPEALADAPVPSMILQPVIENAVKHGVARSSQPVTIAIRAWAEGGLLYLRVQDDAQPATAAPAGNGTGVGLTNVRDRLTARFDGAARVEAQSLAVGGFRVTLMMPYAGEGRGR